MMIMQLKYPRETAVFYKHIFEFITFDLIPTEDLYDAIFEFLNDSPFSNESDAIGYGSRYLVLNSGSVTVMLAMIGITHILYMIIIKKVTKDGRVRRFVLKQKAFREWGSFIDFFNECYILLSFSVCINSS